ncbi:uncharacterized protein [Prorops nasuta]|uniref:uncharacterized protein n=1 Tax=Prorops nasuta TaxID=863751 RepID=UPI0034CEEC20
MYFADCSKIAIIIGLAKSSKCPEPRKPHLTSCTIFYKCVNLPSDGYVWVPAKCTQGLVFQPYLRMCVLPGDIWTCDTLENDLNLVTNKYETPQPLDQEQTSYLGYSEDPLSFSDIIDSSYNTDDTTDASVQSLVTPFPLIEDQISTEKLENPKDTATTSNKQEIPQMNNSWNFFVQTAQKNYNETVLPFSLSKFSAEPIQIFNTFQRPGINQNNILLNYLISTYIHKTNLENNITTDMKQTKNITRETGEKNKLNTTSINFSANIPNLLQSSTEADNNIIMISDNLGNAHYLTIDEYKSKADQFDLEQVKILPCTSNVRLSNNTDCTRYYTCNPKTATISEFKCPVHTGFNEYTRVCDVQSYKICIDGKKDFAPLSILLSNLTAEESNSRESRDEQPCSTIGKTEDPISKNHYYICYSSSDNINKNIKPVRMLCPKNLIFCPEKKVCTSAQLC